MSVASFLPSDRLSALAADAGWLAGWLAQVKNTIFSPTLLVANIIL